ncbi:MAG: aldehyde dehydrogenase family protein [Rubripirellula sp.]|nr:aldehyde dehydrogenase family protein [Rubripirellula sp.]
MTDCSTLSKWATLTTEQRCRRVAKAATTITEAAEELVSLCESEQRVDPADTLGAELVPFCAALKFIGQRGPKILRDKHHGVSGRPLWMWGVQSTVQRAPLGTVLILGTWNYPLLLVGTQAAQALAAGNQVIIKPAIGSEQVTTRMVQAFHDAGVPEAALRQIDSSTESAIAAIDQGVDLIVLTGAAATGRKVMAQAAASLTPTIMELSGCDAVILLPDADLDRAAEAIRFGINVNSGATCIGPRRLLVSNAMADSFAEALHSRLANAEPMIVHPSARTAVADTLQTALRQGATDRFKVVDTDRIRDSGQMLPVVLDHVHPEHEVASADLFAPIASIIRVDQVDQAVKIVNECPYRLAASVFGPPKLAQTVAARLQTGGVTINDLIMPTADPRLPFGGRGRSGFGVTRGEEGLLAMTTPKVVSRRRGRHALHLAPRREEDTEALFALLQILHAGSLPQKLAGMRRMIRSRKK